MSWKYTGTREEARARNARTEELAREWLGEDVVWCVIGSHRARDTFDRRYGKVSAVHCYSFHGPHRALIPARLADELAEITGCRVLKGAPAVPYSPCMGEHERFAELAAGDARAGK